MKKLKGDLTIGRVTSSKEDDFVEISLTEEDSHLLVTRIRLSIEEFGQAITGLAFRPCTFDLNTSDKIGLVREHKTEIVAVPHKLGYGPSKEELKKVLKKHEKDGWRGSTEDMTNHHRYSGESKDGKSKLQSVTFVRHVPKTEKKKEKVR